MNKEEYRQLETLQQVEYINQQLEKSSLNKVAKELGIDESTIRSKFINNGFKRAKTGRRLFVATADTESTTTEQTTMETTSTTAGAIEITKQSFTAMDLETKVNTVNKLLETHTIEELTKQTQVKFINLFTDLGYNYRQGKVNKFVKAKGKAQELNQDTDNTKVLEKRIDSLEKELEGIKDIIKALTTGATETINNTTTTDTTVKHKIKRYKGADSSRSYRINNKVLEQWKTFCKAHSEHKVGDLVANALVDYMNKFN